MQNFRCYALDERGRIVAGESIEADSVACAIDIGWQFVGSVPAVNQATGLEIWQGGTKLFSTAPNIAAYSPPGIICRTPRPSHADGLEQAGDNRPANMRLIAKISL